MAVVVAWGRRGGGGEAAALIDQFPTTASSRA